MDYDVAADLKIYVQENSHIEQVKKDVEKIVKVQKFWEEELAFGLKVLKATILINDKEGGMSEAEEKIRKIENVSELEVENISRI